MTNQTRIDVSGGEDIQKLLMELPLQYQKRGLDNAFRAGAKIVMEEAKSQARGKGIGDGGFVDSITVAKATKSQRLGRDSVIVIALKKTHSRLAHLFEYGTAPRFRNSKESRRGKKGDHGGGYTGRISARPFLRPALDIKGAEAIAMIAQKTKENIETIVGQLARGEKVSLRAKRKT
jgi:HK97 gp10 family phage protein